MTALAPVYLEYVILGTDAHYYHKSWDGVAFSSDNARPGGSEWNDIGGPFITEPAVCRWHKDVFVFGVDTDSSLFYRRYNGTTRAWHGLGWTRLGSQTEKWLTKPGIAASYPDYIELIIVGHDRGMYQFWYDDVSWSTSGSGFKQTVLFKEPPVLTKFNQNRFDIFCTGNDGKIYHKWWVEDGGWYPTEGRFEDLGGPFHAQVGAISTQAGTIDLLVVGFDSKLHHRRYNGSWKEWETLSGSYKGVPEVTSSEPGRLDAFVVDRLSNVEHKVYTEKGGWSRSEVVAGPTISERVTATSKEPGRIDLTFINADSKIHHKTYERDIDWIPRNTSCYDIGGNASSRVGTES